MDARGPNITWSGWRRVIARTAAAVATDRMSLCAAGCAFYATLALFPAITMLVSIYGLMFNPRTVERQLAGLHELLPPTTFKLIADRVHMLVSRPPRTLTFSLAVSLLVALWSSTTGTKAIIGALNLAYAQRERRSMLRFQLISFCITLGGIMAAIIGLACLVLLPVLLRFLGYSGPIAHIARTSSLAVLLIFVLLALSILYRFGPSRRTARWHWITPGSGLATLLWLVASLLFSAYVQHMGSYDAMYGPIGAVVGVMIWFYVSAFATLVGAELNSELEQYRADMASGGGGGP
jgi:membrane protein